MRLNPFISIMLLAGSASLFLCESVYANEESKSKLSGGLNLPGDFLSHLYDVPLAMRVDLNGLYLGDATGILTQAGTVRLLELTEGDKSEYSQNERAKWLDILGRTRETGQCKDHCEGDLVALHYSLENSQLSIVTGKVEQGATMQQFLSLPENNSAPGGLLNNQLNLYSAGNGELSGNYSARLTGSFYNWTTQAAWNTSRSADSGDSWQQNLQDVWLQRELGEHSMRVGQFAPTFSGVIRQPASPDLSNRSVAGVMVSSSDNLRVKQGQPALYPVYVTATRQGAVEIYRDNKLIMTGQVEPGLETIDTRRLPDGIYEVEIRVIEDGQVVSRKTEIINKPLHWRSPDKRWRYDLYAGNLNSFLNSYNNSTGDAGLTAGGALNYLAHPRVVLGVMGQRTPFSETMGVAADWYLNEMFGFYSNLYHSNRTGQGADLQARYQLNRSSVLANYTRSWQPASRAADQAAGEYENMALTFNHRLNDSSNVSLRTSRNTGLASGVGADVAFYSRAELFGSRLSWRLSLFDRPIRSRGETWRNHGGEISFSFELAKPGSRSYSAGLGTRNDRKATQNTYSQFSVQQSFSDNILTSAGGSASLDRYGPSLSSNVFAENSLGTADAFVQSFSGGKAVSGGLNMNSTLAMGGGQIMMTGSNGLYGLDTGMILDIESDLENVRLRAEGSTNSRDGLSPGRHFIPVSAWSPETVQLDFSGSSAPAAVITPSVIPAYLNRGGVNYHKVTIRKTVTVMGYLQNSQGQPLMGAEVHNHVGRSVSGADGFFVMEISERQPVIAVQHSSGVTCDIELNESRYPRKNKTIMAGILQCESRDSITAERSFKTEETEV